MFLVIDKSAGTAFFTKPVSQTFTMFIHAANEIVRYPDIERPAWAGRKDVHPPAH